MREQNDIVTQSLYNIGHYEFGIQKNEKWISIRQKILRKYINIILTKIYNIPLDDDTEKEISLLVKNIIQKIRFYGFGNYNIINEVLKSIQEIAERHYNKKYNPFIKQLILHIKAYKAHNILLYFFDRYLLNIKNTSQNITFLEIKLLKNKKTIEKYIKEYVISVFLEVNDYYNPDIASEFKRYLKLHADTLKQKLINLCEISNDHLSSELSSIFDSVVDEIVKNDYTVEIQKRLEQHIQRLLGD